MTSNSEKYKAKKRHALNLGRLCLVLAVVGLVSIIILFKNYTLSLVENRDEMTKYEHFILPVVMMDPVPFDSIQTADGQFIKQAAMWSTLLGDDRDKYAYDENGMLLVPATDLDVSAHKLFGEQASITHETFDDYEATYLFDPDIAAYRVPTVAKVSYSPYVESIDKTIPDKLVLKVGYVAPGNVFTTKAEDKKEGIKPDKYMFYDLVKTKDGMYISAIRDIDITAPPKS
ncbi:MAG: hypothetical protein RRY40_03090 [Oscillospiraceae bacterium]